jgi:hypothetical protein
MDADASVCLAASDGGIKSMMKISEIWLELLALFPSCLGGHLLPEPF